MSFYSIGPNKSLIDNACEDPFITLQIKQARAQERLDAVWSTSNRILYRRIRKHITKLLNDEVGIYRTLEKQADKGKPYVRLTRYTNPFSNPLKFLHIRDQELILTDLVDELMPRVQDQYGPEFVLEVQSSPLNITSIITCVYYEIYMFYEQAESLN